MTVLEGFESFSGGLPNTLNWSDAGSSGQTITQSSSNVTEGSFSCRIQLSNGLIDNMSLFTPEENDLTGVNTVELDINVSSIGIGGEIGFVAENSENYVQQNTSGTGPQTLTLDISGFSDKTGFAFYIQQNIGISAAVDIYIDNLRDDTGAGGVVAGPAQNLDAGFTANYGGQGFIDPTIQKIESGT